MVFVLFAVRVLRGSAFFVVQSYYCRDEMKDGVRRFESESLGISVTASELSRLRHLNSEEGWIDICMDQGLEESKGEGFGPELVFFNVGPGSGKIELRHLLLGSWTACNSHSVTYVPLYDTLGPNAVEFIINHAQVSIAFVQENKIPSDVRYLIEDVQVLKLTIFCGVPRVFDRVYAVINSKISSGGAFGSALFQYAYNYKLGYLEKGLPQDKAAPFFDRLVFDKIKQGLGGRKAATKRMDMQASKKFLAELKVLTHVHHLNLNVG
ncbi:hypothetical protein HN51_068172 [Arachis hypogaea]